ncbi:bifunctional pyr operon transcriptional regulator/uracil phosphoribosyltransferase PyrR [Burkholderiales bacterium]|nr:bifunctional pyr operon transcriptional regulator/uracil phosphoribosyltransferase PyrR [Burkholderiales bacterium]
MLDSKLLTESLISQLREALDPNSLLVGIQSGGAVVMEYLINKFDIDVPFASVDVSFHRDDFEIRGLAKSKKSTSIDSDVDGRHVILVDDVVQSGRTARAAINEIYDFGRPKSVRLAVLMDRGGRELPIEPQFIGGRIDIPTNQKIAVRWSANKDLEVYIV